MRPPPHRCCRYCSPSRSPQAYLQPRRTTKSVWCSATINRRAVQTPKRIEQLLHAIIKETRQTHSLVCCRYLGRYSTCLGDALRDHRIRVGEGCVRQAVAKRPQHSIAARQRGVDPAGASRGWLVVVVAGEDVRRCWEADRPALSLLHWIEQQHTINQ